MHRLIHILVALSLALIFSAGIAQERRVEHTEGTKVQGMSTGNLGASNAVTFFQRLQQVADEHFSDKRYEKAFPRYEELAEYNDKFSQYRLGIMYARGLGVDQDMAKAYAWTYLASETRLPVFTEYHLNVRALLSEEELAKGRKLADKYLRKHGTYAIASKARTVIRRAKGSCAGSRLGSTCDRVSVIGINCGHADLGKTSRKCLTLGAVGIPGISGTLPVALKRAERGVETLIDEYNPGRVEFRELEVIED